jgi:formate dehydrogenase
VVTSDKEGRTRSSRRSCPDADVVISQPFWPAYLTAERIAKHPISSWPSPPASARTTST